MEIGYNNDDHAIFEEHGLMSYCFAQIFSTYYDESQGFFESRLNVWAFILKFERDEPLGFHFHVNFILAPFGSGSNHYDI